MDSILNNQDICTLALSHENEPYLVTLDYIFDSSSQGIYFHCAQSGKKIDFWQANPRVYGQVIEDLGNIQGECDHAYRSVHFWGTLSLISDIEEKSIILKRMIAKFESDIETMNARFLKSASIKAVMVGKISIEGNSVKKSIKSL